MRKVGVRKVAALFVATALVTVAACTSLGDLAGGATNPDEASVDGNVDPMKGAEGGPVDGGADHAVTTAADASDGAVFDSGTFCSKHPSALFCADFDESLDASSVGANLSGEQNGSLSIVPMFPASTPNAFRAKIDTDGGVNAYAYIAKTISINADAGATATTEIYVANGPIGFASAAMIFATGSTIATVYILQGAGAATAGVFWTLDYGNTESQGNTSILVGVPHTFEIRIAAGQVHCSVDGAENVVGPLTAPGAQANLQVGLYNTVTSAPEHATAYFDNVLVTSP